VSTPLAVAASIHQAGDLRPIHPFLHNSPDTVWTRLRSGEFGGHNDGGMKSRDSHTSCIVQ